MTLQDIERFDLRGLAVVIGRLVTLSYMENATRRVTAALPGPTIPVAASRVRPEYSRARRFPISSAASSERWALCSTLRNVT
jgi:hypothetical protein